jgi:hypothetical protein
MADLQEEAIDEFNLCLKKSQEMKYFNDWTVLCEKRLNEIDPINYPMTIEFITEPVHDQVNYARLNIISEMPK